METIRKYLVPILMPLLMAARAFVMRELSKFVSPTSYDLIILAHFLLFAIVAWFYFLKAFSRIALQILIGLAYAALAAVASQCFFIALDAVIASDPKFFVSVAGIVGVTTTNLLHEFFVGSNSTASV